MAAVPCDTVDVAHEALIRGWQRLREWVDADREFRAWQERLRSALRQWQANHYDDGALLRGAPLAEAEQWLHERTFTRPEEPQFIQASLDLRDREQREREAQQQRELELTRENLELAQNAVKVQTRASKRQRVWLVIVALFAVLAGGAAVMAYRGFRQAVARSLVAYAYRENNLDNRETAALLALQASRLDPNYEEIEKALHEIFRTKAIVEEPGSPNLLDQVCEKVKFKKALTLDEWKDYTGGGVSYEPACPHLLDKKRLELRSAPMTTTFTVGEEALSLNLRGNVPIRFVANSLAEYGLTSDTRFERQGEVVIDHATGLMWQQSGSPDPLRYRSEKRMMLRTISTP